MWNTRYFILPAFPNGWRDEMRGTASFLFGSERIFPENDRFVGSNASAKFEDWVDTHDYIVQRNLQELPRAWVVHEARWTVRLEGLSRETRDKAMQEILYAGDPIWNDTTMRVYDPRTVVWVANDEPALRPYLSGRMPRSSEAVTVSYPDPQHAVLEVDMDAPGVVVLADVFYPGWELTIDGTRAPIYRVNGLMRGAAVKQGHHRLVYTFAPRSFRIGLQISLGALVLFFILGVGFTLRPVDGVLGGSHLSEEIAK
jgi:hypothetical protein